MVTKKVLVLGSTGMLGHQVLNYLLKTNEYRVVDIAFRNKIRGSTVLLNVMDGNLLEATIADLRPDIIINCVGVLIKASANESNAIYLNAYLPHQLKNIAKLLNAKLIHVSTDCVFSGDRGGYIESDYRDGNGIYAKTKILGFCRIQLCLIL